MGVNLDGKHFFVYQLGKFIFAYVRLAFGWRGSRIWWGLIAGKIHVAKSNILLEIAVYLFAEAAERMGCLLIDPRVGCKFPFANSGGPEGVVGDIFRGTRNFGGSLVVRGWEALPQTPPFVGWRDSTKQLEPTVLLQTMPGGQCNRKYWDLI